jgi:hypothetical protein
LKAGFFNLQHDFPAALLPNIAMVATLAAKAAE